MSPVAQIIDPDEEAARRHFALGLTHYDAGEYQAALAEFDVVKRFRDSPALDYNIARCYDRLERYQEAVAAYERYVTQKPDASDAAEIREPDRHAANAAGAATRRRRRLSRRPPTPTPAPAIVAPAPTPVDEGVRARPLRRYAAPIAIGAGARGRSGDRGRAARLGQARLRRGARPLGLSPV